MSMPPESDPSPKNGYQTSQSQPPIEPIGVATPPPPPPNYPYAAYPAPGPASKRAGVVSRVFGGLIGSVLLISIGMNIYFSIWFASIMAGPTESAYMEGDVDSRIVVIPIKGMIDSSTADFVHKVFKALRDDLPKAIVLRVDSGGGSVGASDRIWYEITQFKNETQVPVVASFGSVAASGGYYVAVPADYIMAEPTTITGSIGVIVEAFTVQELLNKIGVTPEIVIATEATKKDIFSPWRSWTEDDRQALRSILDSAYDRFVDIVAKGRSDLDLDSVKRLATGEVYTAREAKENKLIDGNGYLDAAIDKAKELAGIAVKVQPMVTVMSPPHNLGLLGSLSTATPNPNSITGRRIQQWVGELSTPRIEYRWVP